MKSLYLFFVIALYLVYCQTIEKGETTIEETIVDTNTGGTTVTAATTAVENTSTEEGTTAATTATAATTTIGSTVTTAAEETTTSTATAATITVETTAAEETTTTSTATAAPTTVDTTSAEESTTIATTTVDTTATEETATTSTATAATTTVETTSAEETTTIATTTVDTTSAEETTTIATTTAAEETTTTSATTTVGTTTTEEITTVETTTSIPIFFLSDNNDVITWSPSFNQSVIIEALDGYMIRVNITECNIDGAKGEFATISTDENTNKLLFTYSVAAHPAYLYNNNRLYGEFFGTNSSNFTAVFTRIGEAFASTTTEVPTITIILPTPDLNDSSTLLVYLAGLSINDYLNPNTSVSIHTLRDAIGQMAAKYCGNENFPLNGSITSDNVIVNYLLPCTQSWPGSKTCVQLNFSVPVHLIEDADSLWTGYQMTTAHMRIMWFRYAHHHLPEGVTIYDPPGEGGFTWGIAILIAATVIFAVILIAVRHYGMKVSKLVRGRKLSDTASIISASDRNSLASLPPHYLQDTPALFENAYPMYNPDQNSEYSEPSYAKSFDYANYEDLSMQLEKEADEDSDIEESGA